jgi:hypothetical protein
MGGVISAQENILVSYVIPFLCIRTGEPPQVDVKIRKAF